ncbi:MULTISPECIES: hypothetical protein [unclassified Flavobacterium]|uniref:hypothetical protein n=1 Tax=unclassified Flavobacterium TaxID=196869 RepID=UPI000F0C94E7|nr:MULTISPECIES: hypothetical protein [unclassified Flavobacterium]AYN05706.1 hypothetical protein EAG11_17265 [Flavobacterium sp. 140616W15]MCD0474277.1 hypothetical protein [Flavobacterium sp. EDS]
MSYESILNEFWQKVKESILNGTFAKLTLAKTIGDTELKNIYFRLVINENNTYGVSLTSRYKTEEIETFHTLEEAFIVLAPYIKNPFLTALLFTTDADITFKVNKKNVGSIIEQAPTFKNASPVMLEMIEKGIV